MQLLLCYVILYSYDKCVRHIKNVMSEIRECVNEREKVNIIVQYGSHWLLIS